MAISYDTVVKGAATGQSSLTVALTVGAISNGMLHLALSNNSSTVTISSVTCNGVAMTLIDSQAAQANLIGYLYSLQNPTSGNIVVTASGNTNLALVAATYGGVKQTVTMDATTKGGGDTGSSHTGTLTTVLDNCWTVMASLAAGAPQTAGTGATERDEQTYIALYDSNGVVTPPGSKSMTVSFNATDSRAYVMASFAPYTETSKALFFAQI